MTVNQTTVRAGTEIRVKTERPEVALSLSEMAKDSWVIFELPGFASATSGKQQDSIDALRKATETSYFKGPDAVWVKLVIPAAPKGVGMDQFLTGDQASITVRRSIFSLKDEPEGREGPEVGRESVRPFCVS